MKRFTGAVTRKYLAMRANESGMEAAQVILILAIVAAILFPIISGIVGAIEDQGNDAINDIRNF
jgi:hypothetical protein